MSELETKSTRTWKSDLKFLSFIFVPLLGLAALLAFIEGDQGARLREAVPRFTCTEMQITTSRSRWSPRSGNHSASSALRMPRSCRVQLEALVIRSGNFTEERCDLIKPCWRRKTGRKSFTLIFYDDYVSFRFSDQD